MFYDFCRWLYWRLWLRLPDEEEILSRMEPEHRDLYEQFKRHLEALRG